MVTIEEILESHANSLAMILSTDVKLNNMLNPYKFNVVSKTTSEEFLKYTHNWMLTTHSFTYAIVSDSIAVGTISIAKINNELKTAGIGYWISSRHWNQGIATQAFRLILSTARAIGIKEVSAKIHKDNLYSIKLWERYNTVFTNIDNYIFCRLNFSDTKV